MRYIVKIVINGEIEYLSKPFNNSEVVDWSEVTYVSRPRLKDSTSLQSALAFGGMASNQLTFDLVNPKVEVLENFQVELFLKGADTGNLPQGNQPTDGGEYSPYVTPEELIDEEPIDSDPDAVDLYSYGDGVIEEDTEATTDETEDIPLPDIYTEGEEDEEEAEEILDDDNPPDPYYTTDTATDIVDGEDEEAEPTAWSQVGGTFNVISVKQNNDLNSITVECLDDIAMLSTDIYTPTENDIDVSDMFDDFVEQCEEDYDLSVGSEIDFPTMDITMPTSVSFRDAIGYFAGLVGGFVSVDDTGSVMIMPYAYSEAEVHGTDFIGKGFLQDSQSSIVINGITCDKALGRAEDLVSVYDGGDAWFENPFMTEEVLREYVWTRVRNLEYYSGTLECVWNRSIRAGQILKIFTLEDDEKRNYFVQQYQEAETDEEREEILEQIENCGRYIVNTNQTIDLVAGTTTISSLGKNITQQTSTTATNEFKKVQRFGTLLADEIEASRIETEELVAQKADINFANVIEASIGTEWVQKLLVKGNVIANNGTVYELDAIHFNTNFIEAGSIKADKLILKSSTDGLYYQLNINADGFDIDALTEEERAKLPDSLHADVIMANTITTKHITVQNLEGTNGWINLAEGTFRYINQNGNGISWDGNELYIRASKLLLEGGQSVEDIISEVWNDYNIVWTGVYDDTELTGQVYVYHYGEDVTDQFSDAIFSWVRRTDYGNQLIASGTKTFTYDQANTMISDTFVLQWYDEMEIELADDNGDTILVTENGTDYTELIGKEGIS